MSNNYLVWDDEETAQAALDFINGTDWFPLTGYNAATGLPAPDKQKTERWADEVLQRNDGKWCFPEIPRALLDAVGVPVEEESAFFAAFNPSIEEYDPEWFAPQSSSSSEGA